MARVEKQTFIVTKEKRQTTPTTLNGIAGQLAKWMSPEEFSKQFDERFPGCMKGLCLLYSKKVAEVEGHYKRIFHD